MPVFTIRILRGWRGHVGQGPQLYVGQDGTAGPERRRHFRLQVSIVQPPGGEPGPPRRPENVLRRRAQAFQAPTSLRQFRL